MIFSLATGVGWLRNGGLGKIQNNIQAEYSPQSWRGYPVWDPILLKDDKIYRLFFLTGNRRFNPFWSVGEVGTATSSDLENWDYLGIIIKPDSSYHWKSGRILSGSVFKENKICYFFHSASPNGASLLREGIGLTISVDGQNWIHCQNELVEPNGIFYDSQPNRSWRDPFIIKDHIDGKYYLFITASSVKGQSFKGCVGLAVAERIEGPYKLLPPAAHPLFERTEESLFHHMERPQVIYRDNKYYLFFSTWKNKINPNWLQKLDQDRITDSSLYWYVSDKITGPFKPIVEIPVVYGSEKTGLYGTNLIEGPYQGLTAYGWYYQSFTLEVSLRFQVYWKNDFIKISVQD